MDDRHDNNKYFILAVFFVLLLSMALRVNAPRADLPSDITFSGSILTDEGNQCHNSRSKALYDDWYPDDWRITNYNPVLPHIKLFIFNVFGVGMWQLRLVNFIFAFFSLLFFYLTLRSYFNPHRILPLLGTLLLGTNFLFIMYNKIGTFETSITFWVVLTLYFLEKYRATRKNHFLILSGAAAFMAFVFKSIMAYFLPLPFAACIVLCLFHDEENRKPVKEGAKNILLILAGVLVVAVPWYLFHYMPNKTWIVGTAGNYMGNLMFPKSLDHAFRNFLAFNWKDQFIKIPVVWLAAILYLPLFFRRLLHRKAKLTEIGFLLFFLAHTFMFFVMSYRPTRYFIPVIPALVFMTVHYFKHWLLFTPEDKRGNWSFSDNIVLVFDVLWLTIASAFCFLPLLSRYIYSFPVPRLSYIYLIVSVLLVALYHLSRHIYHKLVWRKPDFRVIFVPVSILLVAVSLFISAGYYLDWNGNKTFTVRDISRELGEKLDNAYIAGMTAPVAVLENRHKALWLYPNFVNWDQRTFQKYPLTHALLGTDVSKEIAHYFKTWPQRMERAPLSEVYHIKDYFLHLYAFNAPYIKTVTPGKDNRVEIRVFNPGANPVKTTVGRVHLPSFNVVNGKTEYELNPGANTLLLEPVESMEGLVFLECNRSFNAGPLRYEGEIFLCKVGENIREAAASGGWVRRFERAGNTPGFLSYGPAVPYAPGVLVADFNITFHDLQSKLRPVATIDIFSYQDNGPIAQMEIKAGDIKKSSNNNYRLRVELPVTKTLEFRLQTTPFAGVSLDYVDVTYYQGAFLNSR